MASNRLARFEYPDDDFPFYNQTPIRISALQWCFVLAMVVAGFLALILPLGVPTSGVAQIVRTVLFFALPLAALAIVAPKHWKRLFRPIGWRDVKWMVLFALLNMVVTMSIGALLANAIGANSNPVIGGIGAQSTSNQLQVLFTTAPQLFGEEVFTILPFLALMTFFFSTVKCSRGTSILLAWIISSAIFGLIHLPTYNWNVVQCLVFIGSARLVLSLAYIKTKNIWVSTGAHIINDWSFLLLAIFVGSVHPA